MVFTAKYNSLQERCFWAMLLVLVVASVARSQVSRPGDANSPTEVRVRMLITDVDAINSAEQSFTVNLWVEGRWNDSRLEHTGKGKMTRELHDVWNPRLQFVNQQKIWPTLPELVEVYPNGEVVYLQRIWGPFSQPLNLHDFPFDDHEFSIILVAAAYSPDEVRIIANPVLPSALGSEFSVADWDITGWKAEGGVYKPLEEGSGAPAFILTFQADRNVGYFILKVILPLLFIVCMSWTVFWIDPMESGTQISIAITSMLTLIAYRFMVGSLLPNVSYLTRIDIFVLGSTALVFATLVEVVVTSRLAHREKLALARLIDLLSRFIFAAAYAVVIAAAFFY